MIRRLEGWRVKGRRRKTVGGLDGWKVGGLEAQGPEKMKDGGQLDARMVRWSDAQGPVIGGGQWAVGRLEG